MAILGCFYEIKFSEVVQPLGYHCLSELPTGGGRDHGSQGDQEQRTLRVVRIICLDVETAKNKRKSGHE